MKKKIVAILWRMLVWVPLFFFSLTTAAAAAPVDNRIYAELLQRYNKAGVIDYAGLKADEHRLDAYLEILEQTETAALSRDELMAFYINAYNVWTIKLILTGYPGVKSIKEFGSLFRSPWKKKIVALGGEKISLDDIEHGILRPRFQDNRVHFAVNCASKGCPPLFPEPFTGERLHRQLDRAAKNYVNDPRNYRLEGNRLFVNEIFKWFSEDFPEGAPGFYLRFAEEDLQKSLLSIDGKTRVRYYDYDWSLNGR